VDTDTNAATALGSSASGASSAGEASSLSTLAENATPLAGTENSSTQSSANDSLASVLSDPLLWIMLGMCGILLALFGYAFITRNAHDKDEEASN
jgi:hypothetical protein